MKLSKKTGLVIAIGILVIALIGLGMVISQQADEQNQLNAQLDLIQSRLMGIKLEQLSSRQAELETQLSQATSQFEAVKAIFSQPIGSVAAATALFDVAEAHGLEVTEMTSSTPAIEILEEVTFSVISLTAKVEGDVPSLVGFVTELNSFFTTGVIKSTTITIPETDNETNNEKKASVDIHLVIYTYQGD